MFPAARNCRAVALRVNDVVAVGQAISVTPTAGSANTVVDSTLPYASAMTNAGDLIGVGSCFVSTSFVGVRVLGETTGDLAQVQLHVKRNGRTHALHPLPLPHPVGGTMPEKNNGKWTNRRAVQKAFDRDPQHAYNVVNAVVTPEQATTIEAALIPAPTKEERVAELVAAGDALEKHGVDTKAVLDKISELLAE
jgi:hypothetical protein